MKERQNDRIDRSADITDISHEPLRRFINDVTNSAANIGVYRSSDDIEFLIIALNKMFPKAIEEIKDNILYLAKKK